MQARTPARTQAKRLPNRRNVECPRCSSILTRSRGGGYTDDGLRIRRRCCMDCRLYFSTVEVPVLYDDGTPVPLTSLSGDFRVYNKLRQRDRIGYHGTTAGRKAYAESARIKVDVKVLRRPYRSASS